MARFLLRKLASALTAGLLVVGTGCGVRPPGPPSIAPALAANRLGVASMNHRFAPSGEGAPAVVADAGPPAPSALGGPAAAAEAPVSSPSPGATPSSGALPPVVPSPARPEALPEVSVAIARAVDFLAAEDGADWSIELGRSFGARRWGIARFDGAVARYDQLEPTDQTRVWRRMIEPDTRVTVDNLAGLHEEDYMTGRALHCDRIALPADYGAELKRARSRGGYWHTHAAMAIGILREIGCPLPITSHEATRTIEGLARVRDQERFLTDLALEAEAFLYWLGRRDLTDPRFVDRLRAAQHDDGSWGDPADDTRWHGTVLALFILQFATEASPGTEPWCAGARPATASAQASAPSSGR